jgi:hypothetical protein
LRDDDWDTVMPEGYTRRLAALGNGTYWHLYHAGQRINGGLASDELAAARACRSSARQHELARAFPQRRWDG